MLAVSPLRSCINDEREGEVESFSIGLEEFSCGNNLLDDIDFDDIFFGIDDGDILPDLEMDSDMLADFSISGGEETSDMNFSASNSKVEENGRREEDDRGSGSGSGSGLGSGLNNSTSQGEEIVSKRDEQVKVNSSSKEGDHKDRKSSKKSKSLHGKRKMKVDWTPELHRRFVQAVEQLGMDKAVPSRILELMGIDCLTRHNIASHLQKYRSHQKHLRAREAEAASWNQRRQIYGTTRGGSKREMAPWIAPPTIGFPPPPPTTLQPFRPLHVWGHPTVDQSMMHMWPKHLAHSPSQPRPPWAPPPPTPPSLTSPPPPPLPSDPSYWHRHQPAPNVVTQGTPCMPQTMATARFPTPPVPGIPHHAMYKVDQGIGVPTAQSHSYPPFDFHPSKESIDAAIGDVLSKPWLPLPLGLKPPSLDSVMVELQRQGVPKIPPTHAS